MQTIVQAPCDTMSNITTIIICPGAKLEGITNSRGIHCEHYEFQPNLGEILYKCKKLSFLLGDRMSSSIGKGQL